MLRKILLATLALVGASAVTVHAQVAASTFVINEIDSVQSGGNTRQFVELFNDGPLPEDLSSYSLGFYDGAAANNASYMKIQLNSVLLPAGGYYVVGNPGVANVDQTFAGGALKTGVDAIILYRNNAANPIAPTILNPLDIANFRDGAVYGQGTTDVDLDLLMQTGEFPFQYNENFGVNLGGPGDGGQSLSRVNGSDANPFEVGTPTPGAFNNLLFPGVPAAVPNVPEPTSAAVVLAGAAALVRRRR